MVVDLFIAHLSVNANEKDIMDIIDCLGSYHSLEMRLLRVRDTVIGPNPRNRDMFNPEVFLKNVFDDDDDKIIVLDSNSLPVNWEDFIDDENPSTAHNWNNLNETIKE